MQYPLLALYINVYRLIFLLCILIYVQYTFTPSQCYDLKKTNYGAHQRQAQQKHTESYTSIHFTTPEEGNRISKQHKIIYK